MTPALASAPPALLYVAGDPALDLVNTVDWTSRGPEVERLGTYDRLLRWAEGAGVLDPAAARRLSWVASERPQAAAAALDYARQARETLQELFAAIARGESPDAALPQFNRLLAEAMERLEIVSAAGSRGRDRGGYDWRWRGQDSDPRAVVWPVIWSAASLLKSEELTNVRVCDSEDCGWMFVDRSRNGLRRWCQMRSCGTREKSRRRRESS